MKKLILMAFASIIFFANANANNGNEISPVVTQAFESEFCSVNEVRWSQFDGYIKASFKHNGENIDAYYNYDGSNVGYSKKINLEKLPEAALRSFTKKYPFPTYQLKEVIEFTNAEGTVSYYISLDKVVAHERTIINVTTDGNVYFFKKMSLKN